MHSTRRRHTLTLALTAISTLGLSPAFAADPYPTKPITLIVPFSPGGGNDTVARVIGQTISGPLGQQVLIDNKPGAGGSLGAEIAARAPGDGHTLFIGGVGSHALNPTINPKLRYDPLKDFVPIVWIASAPMVLAVHPSVPVNNIKQLIEYAKKNPGKLNYASNGNGSSSQLAAVIFNSMAGTNMVHVPYKGLAPAQVDLMAGTVQIMFSSSVAIMPSVQNGKLKVLGVTSPKRMLTLPNVPTIAEGGFPGYDMDTWIGLFVPRATPDAIVKTLHDATLEALKSQSARDRFEAVAGRIAPGSGAELDALVANDIRQLTKVVKERGIKPE